MVHSGSISRARGIETLVDALALLPGVHLAVVVVPYPHPMAPELHSRAADLGAVFTAADAPTCPGGARRPGPPRPVTDAAATRRRAALVERYSWQLQERALRDRYREVVASAPRSAASTRLAARPSP